MVYSSTRAFGSPFKYIQGPGEFNNLEKYVSEYGKKAYMLIESFLYDKLCDELAEMFRDSETAYITSCFTGECSDEALEKFGAEARDSGADVLVGIGGGKTMDTAKLIADVNNMQRIIVPTSAASDAPTASMSVMYKESGEYLRSVHHKRGSELVLVDSRIIIKAPVRLFAAGIADALATYYEARANAASDTANYIGCGYRRTKTGLAIAETCYNVLMNKGLTALRDVKCGALTEAVEDVIEANILMSGLGFENTGCAGAHSVHTGAQEIPSTKGVLHGEMVAFGILFQLILENSPDSEIDKIARFLKEADLPMTFRQIGVEPTEENIGIITERIVNGDSGIDAEPFLITEELVYNSLIATDALGRRYLEMKNGLIPGEALCSLQFA